MTPDNDPLLAAAFLLAGQDPRGWRRLQAEHVADATGHCRACRQAASGAAPVWPCRLASIAEYAEQFAADQGFTSGSSRRSAEGPSAR